MKIKDLGPLIRKSFSAAIHTMPLRRQQLFALLPPDTFSGLAKYYRLGRFFANDTCTESTADIAKATGIDPVEMIEISIEDENFIPLQDHLVRLLTARQTYALTTGLDVIQWAAAITRISEAMLTQNRVSEEIPGDGVFIPASDMLLTPVKIDRLLGKIIERGTTGQVFGPSGGGKTFITLDMALAIATGGEWNGNQCEQGIVLYFAGEGHAGLRRRVKAWHQHNGRPDMSCCHITRYAIPFDRAGLTKAFKDAQLLVDQTGRAVALIVVDTLARHIQGDENSTQNMSDFIRATDWLRDAFPGSTAIIVHHTGNDAEKSGRSRGSSSLKAAMDFEIQCSKGLLTYTKVKDGEEPEPTEFKLMPVRIGTDEDGEPITSCVVQYGERSAKNREVGLTINERLIFELAKENPDVLIGDLRSKFYDKRRQRDPDVSTGTLKTAWLRSYAELLKKQVVNEINNVVIIPNSKPAHGTTPAQNDNVTGDTDRHNRHTLFIECADVPSPVSHICSDPDTACSIKISGDFEHCHHCGGN